MGITNPTETAATAYRDSKFIAEPLAENIVSKRFLTSKEVLDSMDMRKKQVVNQKERNEQEKYENIKQELPDHLRRLTVLN